MNYLEEILASSDDDLPPQSPPPPPPPSHSMISIALGLAGRGKPVFPCNSIDKKPLVPRDKDAAGNPIPGTGGFKKATTDVDRINAWWDKWPNAMVGLPTGEPIGVWVLEIDISDKKTRQ
jgi:putative DNA primase/helicase